MCADQGVDAEIKSRGTFLNMFSLIVTQETDSVMGLAEADSGGGHCGRSRGDQDPGI